MPDVFTKAKRSEVMSRIRGRGNKATEIALVRLMRKNRITGWRRHLDIFGRPDFTFYKQRVIVFVDGCYWHACPKHSRKPRGNADFWNAKFSRNKARDRRVNRNLRKMGWRVLRIWEHDLAANPVKTVMRLQNCLEKPARTRL
jgi:DNA mismatch endonuclease (patch repair protein)